MALLTVDHVSFSYDGVINVLHDVTLGLEGGSVVGLIGPNGSGKSTLIKNIVDLVRMQSGSITVNDATNTSAAAKADVVYLASNEYLPEFLTAREYLDVLSKLYGVTLEQPEVERIFERFSMRSRWDDLIEDYSHGMRKKTQIISALLMRRPLTIVDETLNGIDIEALYLCEKEFRQLRDEGRTVLLCTHDFSLLERLADRILFLDLGTLVIDGPTHELVEEHGSLSEMVFRQIDADVR